uniref:F-box domain-containing protein n=1 Tax=Strongyloides papillosus TaxID=174720 RepID=A0A0N5BSH5_STREA
MESEDSINPLNNEVESTPDQELTPAQIIANNTEILSLIFGHIVNFKERRNIELTCRKFYEVCNNKSLCSYFPLEEKSRLHFSMRHEEVDAIINIFGHKMTINIPKEFLFNENNMDIFGRFFRKYLSKVNTLIIVDMSLKHVDFFMNLNCFEKIKNVSLYSRASVNGGDVILSKCSTLNPVNLRISTGYLNDITIEKIGQYPLPDSIETIRLNYSSLKWLLGKMETKKLGSFGNLEFECDEPLSFFMNEINKKEIYLKSITYFKNISCKVYNFKTIPYIEEFNNILLENNIGLFVTIRFNDIFREIFSNEFERDSKAAEHVRNLKNPENRFLAQEGVYLNIKKLKILDIYKERCFCPFFSTELKLMTEDILRMKRLSLFEMHFSLFDNSNDFEKLCTSLGRIQTIRIHDCGKMNIRSLYVLSAYAKNLKNMSLNGVNDKSITTSIILSHFKTLDSLEIIFENLYDAVLVFNDLMEFDNASGSVTFNWPKIQHLNIICNRPNFEEEKLINEVKKNTP